MSVKKTILISAIIIAVGIGLIFLIFRTEPTAKKQGATKQTAMLVDVIEAEHGNFRPKIVATGTVIPSQDIILSPRISGEVLRLSPNFTPGGFIPKGNTMLQIDPADYKNILEQRKSELRQAEADLNIEMGRQQVAEKDYELLNEKLTNEQEALILRKPQLNAARSRVESARAAVDQAELELQRTTIRAPFDAHVISRNVNVGSQVSPGQELGRLVGMDTYWIETTIPLAHLRWLSFPENDNSQGSAVKIRNRSAWAEGEYRVGHLYKMIGALEENTRMARVLVTVEDPLAYHIDSLVPKLMLGSFVETTIIGEELTDVVRVNRDYLRKNETVWVKQDSLLFIRDVDIIFKDARYAYISSGLKKNDRVVTTNLSTVTDSARLRVEQPDTLIQADTMNDTITSNK